MPWLLVLEEFHSWIVVEMESLLSYVVDKCLDAGIAPDTIVSIWHSWKGSGWFILTFWEEGCLLTETSAAVVRGFKILFLGDKKFHFEGWENAAIYCFRNSVALKIRASESHLVFQDAVLSISLLKEQIACGKTGLRYNGSNSEDHWRRGKNNTCKAQREKNSRTEQKPIDPGNGTVTQPGTVRYSFVSDMDKWVIDLTRFLDGEWLLTDNLFIKLEQIKN